MRFSHLIISLTAFFLFVQPHSLQAAAGTDPDWPCIQRKVPHISPGMVWAGPAVDEKDRSWEKDKELFRLVTALAQRRMAIEEAEKQIAAYVDQLAEGKKDKLTLLFTGLLQTINEERDAIMSGIDRYSRQQGVRADGIRMLRKELVALTAKDDLSDEEKTKRDELEERLNWDTRIYDERSQSLTYVCESPRILEQRLFSLARAIQQHMD